MKPQQNDQEIADVLGKFFESVFTMEDDGDNILPEFELDIIYKVTAVKRRQGLWSRCYTSKDIEGLC